MGLREVRVVFLVVRGFCLNFKITSYRPEDLPHTLRIQVIDFIRCIWPHGFRDQNQFRDWIHPESDHPLHFVMVHNETLIGHASVLWKTLKVGNDDLKVYGLSGVIIYPNFQRLGLGLKLIKEATTHILMQDGDLAVLGCSPEIAGLYTQAGWLDGEIQLSIGNPPQVETEVIFSKVLSEKGQRALSIQGQIPIHFGDYGW
jgi:predicted N-acetyltransferase YhbS